MGFPGGSDGKESAAMQETWVRSLGQEDPPEKVMATHSSIIAWRIPWTQEPGGLESMGLQRVGVNERQTACAAFYLQVRLPGPEDWGSRGQMTTE